METTAKEKAAEVANRVGDPAAVILAADTAVEIHGRLLGKPRDEAEAFNMLRELSGQTHRVWTGVCLVEGSQTETAHECTEVVFRPMSDEEIRAYIATGEPMDKAGAYGYQGLGGVFVREIHGDYFNVVGLPLCRLQPMLLRHGIRLLSCDGGGVH